MKRGFDLFFSFLGIVFFLPLFLLVSIIIKCSSKGPIFYTQTRVGRHNQDFRIFKFRTMYLNADQMGLLTIGDKDSRITGVGYFLRKYKIDELPQIFNVFLGEMSFVGPRPEVRKYVALYSTRHKKVLTVRPGITDLASIEYRNESALLDKQEDSNQFYIDVIMPHKLEINLSYIENRNIFKDIYIIFTTLKAIIK